MTSRTLPPTKRPPLPTAMTLAVLATLSAAAQAQTAAPAPAASAAKPADTSSSTVVVTGLRAALESALNAKREDKGIVDVGRRALAHGDGIEQLGREDVEVEAA